jgi:hypothetical protein
MSFFFSRTSFFNYGKRVPLLRYVQSLELCCIGARNCFSAESRRSFAPRIACQNLSSEARNDCGNADKTLGGLGFREGRPGDLRVLTPPSTLCRSYAARTHGNRNAIGSSRLLRKRRRSRRFAPTIFIARHPDSTSLFTSFPLTTTPVALRESASGSNSGVHVRVVRVRVRVGGGIVRRRVV